MPLANCPRCSYPIESIEHLVKDCSCYTTIWSKFGSNSTLPICFVANFDAWLFHNLKSRKFVCDDMPWYMVFAVCLWYIWNRRCKLIFQQGFVMPIEPQQVILQYVVEWFTARKAMTTSL